MKIYSALFQDISTQRMYASTAENYNILGEQDQYHGCWALSQYKDSLSMYVDFPYKDKMVVRPSYLYNGNSYSCNMTSLYWDGPLIPWPFVSPENLQPHNWLWRIISRADFRIAPSQWGTALLCNDVSHWLGTSLESALTRFLASMRTTFY